MATTRRGKFGPRPTTTQRQYGWQHQKERARYARIVDAGNAYCQQGIPGNGSSGKCYYPTRWIQPGTPWALGHTDDRTSYIGPCHALCNQRDGATRGGQAVHGNTRRNPTPRTPHGTGWRSRTW